MADEEWVQVASADDSLVAELLVMLKHVKAPPPPPPPPSRLKTTQPALSLEWSVRQRRSRPVVVQAMKTAPPRASPTTPLSWSGATSVSGGGGGSFDGGAEEESGGGASLAKRSDASRSKVIGSSEAEASNSKKPKRKRTLTELKKEEDSLEEERRRLNRELASVRLNLEKERATNEKLKRIKMEMQAFEADKIHTTPAPDPVTVPLQPAVASNGGLPLSDVPAVHKEVGSDKFVLPDLNIPFEDNSSCDVGVCGLS